MPAPQSDEDGVILVSELFERCRRLHEEAYPGSSIDFDQLNLTGQLTHGTWAHAKGHYADVYKGEMSDGMVVAVKMLRLPGYHPTNDKLYLTTLLRFFRELNHWEKLSHTNIVRMLGFTLANGNISLISRWHQHGSLVQYLKAYPDANKQDLILDVAEGTLYLHTCTFPLVHGDIKGANVLVCEMGIARLTDFGISKQIDDMNRITGFTTTSGAMGTVPWMAPELDGGSTLTFSSDVYSCAGVFLEISCPGKPPYYYIPHARDIILEKDRGELPQRFRYPEMDGQDSLWLLLTACWHHDPLKRPEIKSVVQSLYRQFRLSPRLDSTQTSAHRAGLSGIEGVMLEILESMDRCLKELDVLNAWEIENASVLYQGDGISGWNSRVHQEARLAIWKLLDAIYSCQRVEQPIFTGGDVGSIFLAYADEIHETHTAYAKILPSAVRFLAKKFGPGDHAEAAKIIRLVELPLRNIRTCSQLLRTGVTVLETDLNQSVALADAARVYEDIWTSLQAEPFPIIFDSEPCSTTHISWSQTVSQKTLQAAPHFTLAPDNVRLIFEFMATEAAFIHELDSAYLASFRSIQTRPPTYLPSAGALGISEIIQALAGISRRHGRMLDLFHFLQRTEHPFIQTFAKIIFPVLGGLAEDYDPYISQRLAFMSRTWNEPTEGRVSDLCRELEKLDLTLRGRLVEYQTALAALQECTSVAHPDQHYLTFLLSSTTEAIEMIDSSGSLLRSMGILSNHPQGVDFGAWDLTGRLDLSGQNWTLFRVGHLLYQGDKGSCVLDERHVLLFDNYLLVTTQVGSTSEAHYVVMERPIPTEFLLTQEFGHPSKDGATFKSHRGNEEVTTGAIFGFRLSHVARADCDYTFYSRSSYERAAWKSKLKYVIRARHASLKNPAISAVHYQANPQLPWIWKFLLGFRQLAILRESRITCFVSISSNYSGSGARARRLVAFGSDAGVWTGHYALTSAGGGYPSWEGVGERILPISGVTQCAVVKHGNLLLVLANGILWAYELGRYLLSLLSRNSRPWRLNRRKDVQFFRTGIIKGHTVVILKWKKKAPESGSIFNMLEICLNQEKHQASYCGFMVSNEMPDWCGPTKEFSLPYDCYDVVFLKSAIVFLSSEGFEVMDLDFEDTSPVHAYPNLSSVSFLPSTSDFAILNRQPNLSNSRPLGLFSCRGGRKYILCYDGFGAYVNQTDSAKGSPPDIIRWEGTAERISLSPPYLLVFQKKLIEIWHIDKGRRLQTIIGDTRCLQDGTHRKGEPIYFVKDESTWTSRDTFRGIHALKTDAL